MFYFDTNYLILVVPAMIFSLIIQARLNSVYSTFSKVDNYKGITGAQAARMVLDSKGLTNVTIEPVAGSLTDHFDPRSNVIRLSEGVYNCSTVAAIGIAAHEAGHAIQHAEHYFPNKVRSSLVPVVNFGSKVSMWLIVIGLVLSNTGVSWIATLGVILFATSTVFALVTLPVEFNASARAMKIIESEQMADKEELKGVRKVLSSAAMTYVAALAVSVAQFLHLFLLVSRSRRSR